MNGYGCNSNSNINSINYLKRKSIIRNLSKEKVSCWIDLDARRINTIWLSIIRYESKLHNIFRSFKYTYIVVWRTTYINMTTHSISTSRTHWSLFTLQLSIDTIVVTIYTLLRHLQPTPWRITDNLSKIRNIHTFYKKTNKHTHTLSSAHKTRSNANRRKYGDRFAFASFENKFK